jgi:hypothetical protein
MLRASSLTSRWFPMRPHQDQHAYFHSRYRYNVVIAGRRGGKTELAKRRVVTSALSADGCHRAFGLAAPKQAQADHIFWRDLRDLVPPHLIASVEEDERVVRLTNRAEIYVFGFDNRHQTEGRRFAGLAVDLVSEVDHFAWSEVLWPMWQERVGWIDIVGSLDESEREHDILTGLYISALSSVREHGERSPWFGFRWSSEPLLLDGDIAEIRSVLGEQGFRRAIQARFSDELETALAVADRS